jgi:electron transfer flavoprotein alpha subunit
VGATRTVCERGDLPRNRAIGLYGRPVAPRLLVAVGLSGDLEERTGFVKAGVVAAVNHGESPMLGAADVGAIIHWEAAIPALAGALQ